MSGTEKNVFADVDDIEVTQSTTFLSAEIKSAELRTFENEVGLTDLEKNLADNLGVSLQGSHEQLVQYAIIKANESLTCQIEAGLFLLAAKAQCEHGEFKPLIEYYGFNYRRAVEWMTAAKFVAKLEPEQREEMVLMGKSKVLLLSQAEPEAVGDLLSDEDVDLQALTFHDIKQRLRETQAKLTQKNVEVQKAEAEKNKLEKQLAAATTSRADISDIVPPHVSDIRLEVAALFKKSELSIDGIARQINDIHLLEPEWSLSAARSTFAALQSLIAQAKGAAAALHKAYGSDLDGDNSTMERLTQKELFKCATEFKELIAEHEHEAALRAHERDQDKPKGKGRPKAAPVKD